MDCASSLGANQLAFAPQILPPVAFKWVQTEENDLTVSWHLYPETFGIHCYFITLIQALCYPPFANISAKESNITTMAFSVDPRIKEVTVNMGRLVPCSYKLGVSAQRPKLTEDSSFVKVTVGNSDSVVRGRYADMRNYFDGDFLIILLAFLFWAILISTFFKEWGAIKNLQPRDISRQPTPYPHNVTDVKVIQRERESVINCRSPDLYSSRVAKFTKMRQFRHSASKTSEMTASAMIPTKPTNLELAPLTARSAEAINTPFSA